MYPKLKVADFPDVFLKLCHGTQTNENPITIRWVGQSTKRKVSFLLVLFGILFDLSVRMKHGRACQTVSRDCHINRNNLEVSEFLELQVSKENANDKILLG